MADTTKANDAAEVIDVYSHKGLLKTSEVAAVKRFASKKNSDRVIENAKNTVGFIPAGYWVEDEQELHGADPAYKTGDGTIKWVTHGGKILHGQSITAATTITSEGKYFWCSDNQTLSLDPVPGVIPHGFIWEWRSASDLDLYVFSPLDVKIMQAMGGPFRTIKFTVEGKALEGTAKITLGSEEANFSGEIVSARVVCAFADSPAAGAQKLQVEVNNTLVAGLEIDIANDDSQGEVIDGSAVTGDKAIDNGDEIELILKASGTGFSASNVQKYEVQIVVLVEG